MEFAPEIIQSVSNLQNKLKTDYIKMKAEAEEVAKREKLITDLLVYLSKGWSMHFLNLTERESARLKSMRGENNNTLQYLEEAYRLAKEDSDKTFKRYPTLLDVACRSAKINLDPNSPHPKYGIKDGFFRLEIIENKRMARLSDNEGRLAELPADISAVVELLTREYKRIFERRFHGSNFLKQIRANYKSIVTRDKLHDGASVPIRELTKLFGKKIKDFRTDEFIVDLSYLAERGPYEIEGRILDLQQTKDTSQGILLSGAAARGYIGFIIFKELS